MKVTTVRHTRFGRALCYTIEGEEVANLEPMWDKFLLCTFFTDEAKLFMVDSIRDAEKVIHYEKLRRSPIGEGPIP